MATLYKVKFNIQEDETTGEIGLIPDNCPTFNSSWSAIMLFHDTFEHWFEHQHKYFTGDAAENIGAEIAAMGAMWYIYENFIADFRFNRNSYNDPLTNTVHTITYFFDENYHDSFSLIQVSIRKWPYPDGGTHLLQKPTTRNNRHLLTVKFIQNIMHYREVCLLV